MRNRRAWLALTLGAVAAAGATTAEAFQKGDSPALAISLRKGDASHAAPAGVVVTIKGPNTNATITTGRPGGIRFGYRLGDGVYTITARLGNETLTNKVTIKKPWDGATSFVFRR